MTSHYRRTQIVIDDSMPRILSIPKGEDEEALCFSGSAGFNDFGFLTGETVSDISSDEDKISKVYQSSEYRDYLVNNPSQFFSKPSRGMGESPFKASEVESLVSEANLFNYQGMLKVPADFHF